MQIKCPKPRLKLHVCQQQKSKSSGFEPCCGRPDNICIEMNTLVGDIQIVHQKMRVSGICN